MSKKTKLAEVVNSLKPKHKASKTFLIDLSNSNKVYRWIERQAQLMGCSKTVYILSLINQDYLNHGQDESQSASIMSNKGRK